MYYNDQIWHWGVKGMKWGVRRYQNADGSLTDAGKRRYSTDVAANAKKKKDNTIEATAEALREKAIEVTKDVLEKLEK